MIQLRQERPQDYFEVENVIREAFWNYYSPGCSEHYLMHIMRESPAFLPKLALTAADDEKIVGSAVGTKAYIVGDNGTRVDVVCLGPIGVLPEYQSRGIGGRLIATIKEIAAKMGFAGILLCGDPDYYIRQGFLPAESFGVRNAENLYAEALQACELHKGALSDAKGRYFEDEIYQVDESLVKEYDKLFPEKEVLYQTETQKKFERIVKKVKPYL